MPTSPFDDQKAGRGAGCSRDRAGGRPAGPCHFAGYPVLVYKFHAGATHRHGYGGSIYIQKQAAAECDRLCLAEVLRLREERVAVGHSPTDLCTFRVSLSNPRVGASKSVGFARPCARAHACGVGFYPRRAPVKLIVARRHSGFFGLHPLKAEAIGRAAREVRGDDEDGGDEGDEAGGGEEAACTASGFGVPRSRLGATASTNDEVRMGE